MLGIHLIPDKHCLQTLFRSPKKETVSEIQPYIHRNATLVDLNAISIDNNIPLASTICNHYTQSKQTLFQFASNSPYLQRVKQLDESIYQRIVNYLATFSQCIYRPPPIEIPIRVLLLDDINTYMMYILKMYEAIIADNPDIQSRCESSPTQLTSFNHYQIDVRIVPHSTYHIDSKTTSQSAPLDIERSEVDYENGWFDDGTARKEEDLTNGLDVIEALTFMRNAYDVDKYKRFEVIIDRNGIGTLKDDIYKYEPCKGNTVPRIALDNAAICKIVNSKGNIVNGKLNAEDKGVLTISFHITPQSVDIYIFYGYGDGLMGSYVSLNELRQALTPFFHNPKPIEKGVQIEDPIVSVSLDGKQYRMDCDTLTFGDNELHLKTRDWFTNVKTENVTEDVVSEVDQNETDQDELVVLMVDEKQNVDELYTEDESSCGIAIHSTPASSTPMHPTEEFYIETFKRQLAAKGALTEENLAKCLALAQERGPQRQNEDKSDSDADSDYEPNPALHYQSLPMYPSHSD